MVMCFQVLDHSLKRNRRYWKYHLSRNLEGYENCIGMFILQAERAIVLGNAFTVTDYGADRS